MRSPGSQECREFAPAANGGRDLRSGKLHARRLCPSSPAFGLFAARGRAADRRASPSLPRPTASPRWRSPTPTTCSGHWNSPTSWRAPASSRSSAARSRSIAATRTTRCGPAAPARRTQCCRGSCCWRRPRRATATCCISIRAPFSIIPATSRRTSSSPGSMAARDGLIALTGGPDGPLDRGDPGRPAAACGGRAWTRCSRCSATGSMSSCSATALAEERDGRDGADRSRL